MGLGLRASGFGWLLAAGVVAAGCGSGGGGAAPAAPSPAGGGATTGAASSASNASDRHWQVALAALGQSYRPAAPTFDDAGLARWNRFIAAGWADLRWRIDPVIDRYVRGQLSQVTSQFVVRSVKSVTADVAAPPGFASGGVSDRVVTMAPAPPGAWTLAVTLEVGTTTQGTIFGIPYSAAVNVEVTVRADPVRCTIPVDFDMSDPARPVVKAAGRPQVDLTLSITSTSGLPVVQQIAGALTQVLDPIVRAGLVAGAVVAQREIGRMVQQLPAAPWGLGGPAIGSAPAPVDLERLADEVSAEIQRHHIPFGTTMLTVDFDQPGYGNGRPRGYADYGDSAIWTGHYLTAEAFRYDLTGDPRALRGAETVLDGLTACLDLAGPGSGLLARCAVPVSSPFIRDIDGWGAYYEGEHDGVRMGGLGYISRDQYIGAMLGFTHSWLRIPSLRDRARSNIGRVIDYLEQTGWNAYDYVSPRVTAAFLQTPDLIWAFVKAGNMVDRRRFQWLHDANVEMARIIWYPIWMSSREVHDGYYKFNLMHSTMAILVATETDPALYRECVKGAEVMHDATGHHQNGWFDLVFGITVPSHAPAIGPLVRTELELWSLRSRRSHPVTNSQDPTIPKILYGSPAMVQSQPHWVSVYPVPIVKRPHGDFLWQTDAFQLDGGQTSPERQHAGVDLLLPYWVARSYGMSR